MFEDFLTLAAPAVLAANCYFIGTLTARRRYLRQNAVTAQCASCSWESGRLPIAAAFNAAAAHTATPAASATDRHRGFVVQA